MRVSLLCLPLLGLLLSCHKPEPEPDAVPLPAELKAYVMFKPGSYWIYQDSASRQRDSVWVVSADTSVVRQGWGGTPRPGLSMKYVTFDLRTRSTRGGPDLVYSAKRNCGLPNRDNGTSEYPCWKVTRGLSLPTSTADVGGADVFPYAIPREQRRPGFYLFGSIQPYWHTRPVVVAGRSYPDVMEVQVLTDASEGGWPAHYYWAPGLGIVQQRVWVGRVPRTRTLVRSRIVQ